MSKYYHAREIDIGFNFYDKSTFEDNAIYNLVDWIFNVNELKHKNLHQILANDDDDQDDLNTCNTFPVNRNLYNDNIDNPLNDEQFDNEYDVVSSEKYSLLDRIKNEYI